MDIEEVRSYALYGSKYANYMFYLHLNKVPSDIVWGSIMSRHYKIRYWTVKFLLDSMILNLNFYDIDKVGFH
jgi:hypothetical protein